MGRQVSGGLQIAIASQLFRPLEHHMAAGLLLGVEPEITAAGLAEADPIVLQVIASHQQSQSIGAAELQGLGHALPFPFSPLAAVAAASLQKWGEVLRQGLQQGGIPLLCQLQLQAAVLQQFQTLTVQL